MDFPMGVIVANRSDPLLVFKCLCLLPGTAGSPLRLYCKKSFALGGVRPASRPWKPLSSTSFHLIIAGS